MKLQGGRSTYKWWGLHPSSFQALSGDPLFSRSTPCLKIQLVMVWPFHEVLLGERRPRQYQLNFWRQQRVHVRLSFLSSLQAYGHQLLRLEEGLPEHIAEVDLHAVITVGSTPTVLLPSACSAVLVLIRLGCSHITKNSVIHTILATWEHLRYLVLADANCRRAASTPDWSIFHPSTVQLCRVWQLQCLQIQRSQRCVLKVWVCC